MKLLLTFIFTILLFSCASKYRLQPNTPHSVLKNNEGYLGLVFNTLDSLKSIQIKNTDSGEEFYVGRAEQGISQITLKLTEGEYCFVGFDVYQFRVDFTDRGFCTYVEVGELNYFGEFVVRDPITNIHSNYKRYVYLLKKDLPELCHVFVNDECAL